MLNWNVYVNRINDREIELYNVFNHCVYVESLDKIFKQLHKKEKQDIDTLKSFQNLSPRQLENKIKKLEELRNIYFENEIKTQTGYYFWSKCEWEVVIASWPVYIDVEDIQKLQDEVDRHNREWKTKQLRVNVNPTIGKKIDVYDQLRANWEQFILYIKLHEKEIKKLVNENKKRYK